MKTTNLYEKWRATQNQPHGSQVVCFRLPVHVLARVDAVGSMFPAKTRTKILIDLIEEGLRHV